MNNPTLSILIPTYNRKEQLSRAIDSILGQNFNGELNNKVEVIIQNNASTDGTYEFLEEIRDKSPIVKVFHNPENIQLYGNIVEPLKNARGKYVLYLTDDDYMLSHSIEKILGFLKENDYDFIRLNLIVYFEKTIKSFTHLSIKRMVNSSNFTIDEWAKIFASTHILTGNIFKREKINLEKMIEVAKNDNQKWYAHVVIPTSMTQTFCYLPDVLFVHIWENEVFWEGNIVGAQFEEYSPIKNCFFYILDQSNIEIKYLKKLFYQLDPNTNLYPYTKKYFSLKERVKLWIKRNTIKIARIIKNKVI